jgi:hypothetical protein
MTIQQFSKPVKGIDQLSDETSLIDATVRSAENISFDKDGIFERRSGYTMRVSGSGYHSLFSSERGWLIACKKNVINILDPDIYTLTPLVVMTENYLTSFLEFNDNMYFINPGYSGMIRAGEIEATDIGVHLPALEPQFGADVNGTLYSGTYGITYTLVDPTGEESGTGPIQTVELPSGGSVIGTLFTIAAGYKWRIYMTTTDGEELYQAAEFDADVVSYTIGDHRQERQPDTLYLKPLPFGYTIRYHGSRLFVADKDIVSYSR